MSTRIERICDICGGDLYAADHPMPAFARRFYHDIRYNKRLTMLWNNTAYEEICEKCYNDMCDWIVENRKAV